MNRQERINLVYERLKEEFKTKKGIRLKEFVAKMSLELGVSPRTIEDYINTLHNAGLIYAEEIYLITRGRMIYPKKP